VLASASPIPCTRVPLPPWPSSTPHFTAVRRVGSVMPLLIQAIKLAFVARNLNLAFCVQDNINPEISELLTSTAHSRRESHSSSSALPTPLSFQIAARFCVQLASKKSRLFFAHRQFVEIDNSRPFLLPCLRFFRNHTHSTTTTLLRTFFIPSGNRRGSHFVVLFFERTLQSVHLFH
jgi:hypothetical protein